MGEDKIKKAVISGLVWKFGERISAQLISLLVSILLARILMPEAYGSVAIIMVFINLLNVFVSNGLGSALIQKKNVDNLDFSSVFYVNILLGVFLYLLLFLAAPFIAEFYAMDILRPTLRVLGIRIIFAAVNSVQQAYVSRNMMFRRFFWSTIGGTLLSGIVGIAMAYGGWGVWALVAQYLTNTCTDTLVLWFTVRWRPEKACSLKRAKKLIVFGWKLLVSGLIDTGYRSLRNLIIGKLYTSEDLAFYNQGDKYPNLIVTNINTSIGSVLFPALAKYQDDVLRVKQMTRKAIQVSSYIMWPIMMALVVVAEPLVRLLLTDKWLPCVPYLRIFCFSYGLWPIHTSNLQAINAIGRSDLYLKLEIIKKLVGIACLIASVRVSPLMIAYSLIVADVLSAFINAQPNVKLLNYTYGEQFKDLLIPLIMCFPAMLLAAGVDFLDLPDILDIIFKLFVGATVYIAISKVTNFKTYTYLKSMFLQRVRIIKAGKN